MESNESDQLPNGNVTSNKDIDWSRYGLHNTETQRTNETRRNNGEYEELGPEMYQTGANELFAQEYVSDRWRKEVTRAIFPEYAYFLEFRSMVEIKLFHFATRIIWYMGRCIYILPY